MKITIGYNACYYVEFDDDEVEGLTEEEIIDKAIDECYSETDASGCDWYEIDDNGIIDL